MAEHVLRRTETGYLVTTTSRVEASELGGAGETEGAVVVRREPGRLRADARGLPRDLVRQVAGLPVEGVRWSVPTFRGEAALEFGVPGEASVATLLLAGMPVPALARMLGPLGAALRAVHDLPDGGEDRAAPPPGLRRLERWLDTGDGPGDAPRLHALAAGVDGLLEALRAHVEAVRSAPAVVCLGAPGTNTVYPAPDGDHVSVLITDELGAGPAAWDLGWILGELLELANDPIAVAHPQVLGHNPLAQAVLAGYGPSLDASLVGRAAVLRWCVHLHDYAAYVAWAEDFEDRLRRLAQHARDPERVLG
ncbi:hypothetical protein [Nocardioides pantholopis]|uniref:hypothetical protein n=1 Tax=Nocardioides pantholopis TaxID=2483798 RepID=UPI000F098479|nr:hypothetical protein [Nocardioides pantholopis]